ncbi:uncharacterized protein FOMMEDRAFT_160952 [Fomitiporia mediterranea MF3/22]|uniref:uncharacterized protein n=1 Tax=Fomitiporia mediterranea (strain MF3/22) TaxID=694068 RepID=UPI0004408A9C|nr:uncharacterized protein FOMMEDRAFT_160952 [Fomitiporia mediterranea MF3/22]EJC99342.1 hypothetical protein FOMMEDRAFT_160952 [Fomitiporia mediterranea MF3/22]
MSPASSSIASFMITANERHFGIYGSFSHNPVPPYRKISKCSNGQATFQWLMIPENCTYRKHTRRSSRSYTYFILVVRFLFRVQRGNGMFTVSRVLLSIDSAPWKGTTNVH